jgi:hypothetical protein
VIFKRHLILFAIPLLLGTGLASASETQAPSQDPALEFDPATSSLTVSFNENADNSVGNKTVPPSGITSFFHIGPPLVDVGNPTPRDPGSGTPVVDTPEPDAFWSAFLCLFILCCLKGYSFWRSQQPTGGTQMPIKSAGRGNL